MGRDTTRDTERGKRKKREKEKDENEKEKEIEREIAAVHIQYPQDGDTASPVLTSLHGSPVLAVLYWQSCTISLFLAVLLCVPSSACPNSTVLHAIFSLSRSTVLVPFWRSFSGCLVLSVLSRLSCPGCPELAVLL
jgi:hypothetical protein